MKIFKKTVVAVVVTSFYMPLTHASEWSNNARDAWVDGKVETTLLLNSQLNSFDINTDVDDGEVVLTGKVESDVDSSLAEELTLSVEGVSEVDNRLTTLSTTQSNQQSDLVTEMTDKKVTTVVKTRLLMESNVSGTDIDVDTDDRVVTLNGKVDSEAEKQLAGLIARETDDVKDVMNNLSVHRHQS